MSEIIIDKNAKQITFTNNGIAFSQFGIANEILDLIENQEKEIEKLNSIINNAIDFLKENACIDEDVEYFCDDLRYDDCKKLLEILKGSDKE